MSTHTCPLFDPAHGLKSQRLAHYLEREPVLFHQIDGFNPPSCPVPDTYDDDGDELFCGHTYELMSGGPAVRVLITDGTDREVAVRLLRKMVDWLEREPDLVYGAPDDPDVPF